MHALKIAQTLIKSSPTPSIDVPVLHDNTPVSSEELGRFSFGALAHYDYSLNQGVRDKWPIAATIT